MFCSRLSCCCIAPDICACPTPCVLIPITLFFNQTALPLFRDFRLFQCTCTNLDVSLCAPCNMEQEKHFLKYLFSVCNWDVERYNIGWKKLHFRGVFILLSSFYIKDPKDASIQTFLANSAKQTTLWRRHFEWLLFIHFLA